MNKISRRLFTTFPFLSLFSSRLAEAAFSEKTFKMPNSPILLEIQGVYERRSKTGDFYEIRGKGWRLACTETHAFCVNVPYKETCLNKNVRYIDFSIARKLCDLKSGDKIYLDVSAFLADGSLYLEGGKLPS